MPAVETARAIEVPVGTIKPVAAFGENMVLYNAGGMFHAAQVNDCKIRAKVEA